MLNGYSINEEVMNSVLFHLVFHSNFFPSDSLFFASEYSHIELCQYLLDNGVNINIRCDVKNNGTGYIETEIDKVMCPIHVATDNGHLRIVKFLVEKGASIDYLSYYKDTAFHKALKRKNLVLPNYLSSKGADFNIQNKDDMSAVLFCAINGYFDLMELFCNNGANINSKSSIMDSFNNDMIEFETESSTPLLYAFENGNNSIVELLIKKGQI